MFGVVAIGAAGVLATGAGAGPEERAMETIYSVDSEKTIEQVSEALEEACKTHKFGVIAKHDLQAKMKSKGVDFPEACLVYEVCNPLKASEVLSQDMRISTALPCRISIYRQGEGSRLATIRPRVMLDMFGAKELEPVADEVERAIVAIMDDAAGQ
jgi:uncharacterized protein (DUF302 family)